VNRQADRWIRWTTTGCVALLAVIAGTVSYLHMRLLVELHGQPGWVAALTPFQVNVVGTHRGPERVADGQSTGIWYSPGSSDASRLAIAMATASSGRPANRRS
jgi:hypothetical protein